MLTLDQIRKLDPNLADVPDKELLMIVERLYGVANIALDVWQEKGGSKIPFGHLLKAWNAKYHANYDFFWETIDSYPKILD